MKNIYQTTISSPVHGAAQIFLAATSPEVARCDAVKSFSFMLESRAVSILVVEMRSLRAATLAARARLGDKNVGVRVRAGRFDVVRLSFVKRKCTETPLAEGLTMAGAVEFLDAMQPAAVVA